MRKSSLTVAAIVIISTLFIGLTLLPDVRATTLYVGGAGPGNYTTIQAAIDDASPGDIVHVYNGTYYENVVVNKTLSLVGENRSTTIIDGSGLNDVIRVRSDWVNVTGFTMTNAGLDWYRAGIEVGASSNCSIWGNEVATGNNVGIWLSSARDCRISSNFVRSNHWSGIDLYKSIGNAIINNTVADNWHGAFLHTSVGNILEGNVFERNGIFMRGDSVEHWISHVIDTSNTVNGKPVHYWKNIQGGTVPPGAGQVILANSSGVTVENQNFTDGTVGTQLGFSTNVTVRNNTYSSNSRRGISLYVSSGNLILNNNLSMNRENSIYLEYSSNNAVVDNSLSSDYDAGVITNGTYLLESHNNSIADNSGLGNYQNVYLELSRNNTIKANTYTDNFWAIRLRKSSNENRIIDNNATDNVRGISIRDSLNNSVEGNTVSENSYGISLLNSDNNTIRNNSAHQNVFHGVFIGYSGTNVVSDNSISLNTYDGIELSYVNDVIVTNNTISEGGKGVLLFMSENITLIDNTMLGDGVVVLANTLEFWNSHIIDTSNTVNGKPVQYWKDANGGTIPPGAGQVILGNCTNVRVESQHLANTSGGVQLGFSSNNTLVDNTVSDSGWGIFLEFSDDNSLANNSISDTGVGISLPEFNNRNTVVNNTVLSNNLGFLINPGNEDNMIYHNNIIGNEEQAFAGSDTTQWDNGYPSGGNFWSDYNGTDNKSGPNQDQPGSDGIGDTPYVIDGDSQDRYPLMNSSVMVPPRPPTVLEAYLSGSAFENVTVRWSLSPDDGAGMDTVHIYGIWRGSTYDAKGLGYQFLGYVPKGSDFYVDNYSGEGDPNSYFYSVDALDLAGNGAGSPTQAAKFTRPLAKGPHLISIPLIQSNESIETILQTAKYDKAWYYDSSSEEWKWHMTSKGYRRGLWSMNHTMGLWVNVTNDCNLTVAGVVPAQTTIHLYDGWNLVSFPSFNTTYTVADLKAEIDAMRVEGHDPAPPYFLRVLGDAEVLLPGYGYWVKVDIDVDWIVEVT